MLNPNTDSLNFNLICGKWCWGSVNVLKPSKNNLNFHWIFAKRSDPCKPSSTRKHPGNFAIAFNVIWGLCGCLHSGFWVICVLWRYDCFQEGPYRLRGGIRMSFFLCIDPNTWLEENFFPNYGIFHRAEMLSFIDRVEPLWYVSIDARGRCHQGYIYKRETGLQ